MPHFGAIQSWSPQTVSKWISGLHPLAQQHASTILQHNTAGRVLLSLNWTDLERMQIGGVHEQEALLSAIAILQEVDSSNKNFLISPLAERALSSAKNAVDHILHLKIVPSDIERKRELYISCINCSNVTRSILIYLDKYHIVYDEKPTLAHELLCSLYSITQAAHHLKCSLHSVGVYVPEIPQDLPFNSRNSCFATCLQASLTSLSENSGHMLEQLEVGGRGCPTFERIALHPDGDTGWGFSFRETSSGLYIVKRILPNTPADKSGRIKSGDEVIEVNDQNIVGWKIKNVVELIRSQPFGLVMVVRHYPELGDNSTLLTQTPLTPYPATCQATPSQMTPCHVTAETPGLTTPCHARTRVQQLSSSLSEPASDTPKKPPRPKDSVLRERCKSSNELDQHFKTVHNPKRLSQIYGDPNLYLGFEDMLDSVKVDTDGYLTCQEREMDGYLTCPNRRKRTHPAPPAHHKRNNSNPLDKYNILSNREWFDSVVRREDKSKAQCVYGTGPRVKSTKPRPALNVSMPDISHENMDQHRDSTLTSQHVTPPNHATLPRNGVTSPRNSMTSHKPDVVKNIALYCEQYLKSTDTMTNGGPVSDEENNVSEYSLATSPSIVSNTNSEMTTLSSLSTKTLPRRTKPSTEDVGEFKNFPVSKESICTTVIIGGVVHKIPVDTANTPPGRHASDDTPTKNNTATKNRKRQNKRASWSIASDIKSATLPKNIRFSLADLDENGTLKKKKNKKPSRSSSAILGDTNVSCKSLYPNACEGWLMKLGGSGLTPRNWRRRWFVLKGFCLYYFKTPQDNTALGVITLPSFNIATANEIKKKNAFKAYHKNTRTYYFIADTVEEKQRWMDKLLLASILYDENDKDSAYGPTPLVTDVCSMTIEQEIISTCASVQSITSTTVV